MIDIIYEDNHVLVANKPFNMPSQADDSNDLDILSALKAYIKDKYKKPGNVYLGLVHRLDRPAGGLMVFARTSKAAARLQKAFKEHRIEKHYYAIVKDDDLKEKDCLEDRLLKDHRTNMVSVNENGKPSKLSYEVLARKEGLALVDIDLNTGRSHQIRVQFSHRGHPLYGDHRYGNATSGQLALWSCRLSFKHPVKDEILHFTSLPPKIHPFTLFAEVLYE